MNTFEFSKSKEGFDNHIKNSIPGYDALFDQTSILCNHWLNDGDDKVIDIGGATGKLLNSIQRKSNIQTQNKFINVDPTVFSSYPNNELITHVHIGAEEYIKTLEEPVELFLSLFTLQFLSKQDRKSLLELVSKKLTPSGAFFVAEKFYAEDSEYQELYSVTLRTLKQSNFDSEDILEKDYKLLKHLKMYKESEFLEDMCGYRFKCVKYWQSLHFNAYICTLNP